ncbi:uncharacterized [Lates japonicus]
MLRFSVRGRFISIDHLLGTGIAASFCLFNGDPEDRLLADVPLRCCVAAASHTAAEVFCSYSERFGYSERGGGERLSALCQVMTQRSAATYGPPVLSCCLDIIFKTRGSPGHLFRIGLLFMRRYLGERSRSCAVDQMDPLFSGSTLKAQPLFSLKSGAGIPEVKKGDRVI